MTSSQKKDRCKLENRAIIHNLRNEKLLMKKTKFTEQQIAFAVKQAESVSRVQEVCRKMGISEATFYNRKE